MKNFKSNKYFKFLDDNKYTKDIYEAERKFLGENFKRSKSEETLKHKFKLDFRNTFLNISGIKDLLKEVKVWEYQERREKGTIQPPEYEYKNLRRISAFNINQRVFKYFKIIC